MSKSVKRRLAVQRDAMMSDPIILYRYVDGFMYDPDDEGLLFGKEVWRLKKVELIEFRVRRETEKGYWIYDHKELRERWVGKGNGKRYCYDNKKDALHSYKIRKLRQKQHGEWTMERAEYFLAVVKEMQSSEGGGDE